MATAPPACPYCASGETVKKYRDQYHRFVKIHGPFDFRRCGACGAGFVDPIPGEEQLRQFYSQYENGMYGEVSKGVDEAQWHKELAGDLSRLIATHFPGNDRIRWIEVGAGSGATAMHLMRLLPESRGTALDLHPRPRDLASTSVRWIQGDFVQSLRNDRAFESSFDFVYCSAVLEHVRNPAELIRVCLSVARPGGIVYFMCPDYGSWASRLMGTRWPYYLVGEHLSMPTQRSIRKCLAREFSDQCRLLWVRGKRLHYNLRYVFATLGWGAAVVPRHWRLGLPTGVLEFALLKR